MNSSNPSQTYFCPVNNQPNFPRGQPDVMMMPNNFHFTPRKNYFPTNDPDILKQNAFSHNIFHFQGNSPPINPFTPPKSTPGLPSPSAPISPIITSTEFNISKFITKRLPKRRLSSSLENAEISAKRIRVNEEKMSAFMQDLNLENQGKIDTFSESCTNSCMSELITETNNSNDFDSSGNYQNFLMNTNSNKNSPTPNYNTTINDNCDMSTFKNTNIINTSNFTTNKLSDQKVTIGFRNGISDNNDIVDMKNDENLDPSCEVDDSWYNVEQPKSVKTLLSKISDNQRLEIMDGINFKWKGSKPPPHLPPHLVEHMMKPGLQLMLWKPPAGSIANEVKAKLEDNNFEDFESKKEKEKSKSDEMMNSEDIDCKEDGMVTDDDACMDM